MNLDKTERTVVQGKPIDLTSQTDTTTWRTCKKLGTYLDDSAELHRRYTLARAGFHRMYHYGTWALTKTQLLRLEAFHRRQLRCIIRLFYPNRISNAALYTRCDCEPLRVTLLRARWRLFRHILGRPLDIPANIHMLNYPAPNPPPNGLDPTPVDTTR
ncbi:hypothetical protein DYB28_014194 [Aphanomyces astaci]|uniref:Uncharacterized protein n=1 Tax=Aphanomyces astaci TaxID=112090 RepID=A0A9X8HFW4_APHAT|nr:hypothetical protein DYB28_014194 [Aphanomyces astaci]